MSMETRRLGLLEVSALGLGCMGMSEFYGATDEAEAIATIFQNQLQDALNDCDRSLRLLPTNKNTYDSRGFTYLKLGRFAQAIADYDAALARSPRDPGSLYSRGLARLRGRIDPEGGRADLTAAYGDRAAFAGIAALAFGTEGG